MRDVIPSNDGAEIILTDDLTARSTIDYTTLTVRVDLFDAETGCGITIKVDQDGTQVHDVGRIGQSDATVRLMIERPNVYTPIPTTPNWEDINPMYEWMAQDADGCYSYYTRRPELLDDYDEWAPNSGGYSVGSYHPKREDWYASIERRPK